MRVVVVNITIIINVVEMVENALNCENILMKTLCLCLTIRCG